MLGIVESHIGYFDLGRRMHNDFWGSLIELNCSGDSNFLVQVEGRRVEMEIRNITREDNCVKIALIRVMKIQEHITLT